MSASVIAPGLPAARRSFLDSSRWIISRRADLTWFIGSGFAGYTALGLMWAGFPILPIYLLWLVAIDGPHVIATVTRTYVDRCERERLGWWLWIIFPFLLVGPAMAMAGQLALFYLFAICWQHFHIAKQHFGFMMLWKAKNQERDAAELKLDRWFMMSTTTLPLAWFVVETRPMINQFVGVQFVMRAALSLYGALAAYYVIHQIKKWRAGRPMNAPKLMLLGVLAPLQWLAFVYASTFGAEGILRAGITLGLFHSLQYHRLLWYHNHNRYSDPEAPSRNGLAAVALGKHVGMYLAAAIVLHFVLMVVPVGLAPSTEMAAATIWGFAFTHYVLDSRIWRVRGNKELAAALRL